MKKFRLLLIVSVVFMATGCGNANSIKDTSVSDNKENTEVKSETKKAIAVSIGQNIQYDDNYNISFLEMLFTQKIEPTNPESYYTYYPAGDDNAYLVLKTVIKNLGTDTLKGSKLPKAKLIYDNKYNYDAKLMTETDDGSNVEQYDWYMDIEPLKTKKIWYAVEVPKEIENNTNTSIIMEYKINNKVYNVKLR